MPVCNTVIIELEKNMNLEAELPEWNIDDLAVNALEPEGDEEAHSDSVPWAITALGYTAKENDTDNDVVAGPISN